MQGTVRKFDAAKGYGFIADANGGNYFVHHTGIRMSGYRELHEGQQVEFEVREGDRGPVAYNVERI